MSCVLKNILTIRYELIFYIERTYIPLSSHGDFLISAKVKMTKIFIRSLARLSFKEWKK